MILPSIELPVSNTNAWKRRPPTIMDLTDDTFPPLETPKKLKHTGIHDQETTTTTDPNESWMDLDIDKLEQRQNELTATLEKLRQKNETMQHTLQTQFQSAMQALELQMEQRTQSLVSSMGQTINQAVDHMNLQTARSDERLGTFLASFQAQADRMTAQIDRMTKSSDMDTNASPYGTPVRRTKARLCDTRMEVPDVWEMDDDDSADGSRNSHASRASHPTFGMDATTGGKK
jgi:flagellar biosynthesis/type III secretory pathway chaperone